MVAIPRQWITEPWQELAKVAAAAAPAVAAFAMVDGGGVAAAAGVGCEAVAAPSESRKGFERDTVSRFRLSALKKKEGR